MAKGFRLQDVTYRCAFDNLCKSSLVHVVETTILSSLINENQGRNMESAYRNFLLIKCEMTVV